MPVSEWFQKTGNEGCLQRELEVALLHTVLKFKVIWCGGFAWTKLREGWFLYHLRNSSAAHTHMAQGTRTLCCNSPPQVWDTSKRYYNENPRVCVMHCSANRTAESTLKWVIRDASKNNLQWSAEAEARVDVRLDKQQRWLWVSRGHKVQLWQEEKGLGRSRGKV